MAAMSSPLKGSQLASFIDHTLLRPDATLAEVERLCDEALAHGFKAVCVNPLYLPNVAARLAGSTGLRHALSWGFPWGRFRPS